MTSDTTFKLMVGVLRAEDDNDILKVGSDWNAVYDTSRKILRERGYPETAINDHMVVTEVTVHGDIHFTNHVFGMYVVFADGFKAFIRMFGNILDLVEYMLKYDSLSNRAYPAYKIINYDIKVFDTGD